MWTSCYSMIFVQTFFSGTRTIFVNHPSPRISGVMYQGRWLAYRMVNGWSDSVVGTCQKSGVIYLLVSHHYLIERITILLKSSLCIYLVAMRGFLFEIRTYFFYVYLRRQIIFTWCIDIWTRLGHTYTNVNVCTLTDIYCLQDFSETAYKQYSVLNGARVVFALRRILDVSCYGESDAARDDGRLRPFHLRNCFGVISEWGGTRFIFVAWP